MKAVRFFFRGWATLALCTAMVSCADKVADASVDDGELAVVKRASDLPLFELQGDVKSCERTTYYKVDIDDAGTVVIDSAAGWKPVVFNFDKRHHYVTKENEKVTRDSLGRIVRWSDSTPNAKGVHGGFLRDTLMYDYDNPYTMFITGRGEMVTSVRDSVGNIVGQTSTPDFGMSNVTSAHNIVLKNDNRGNWVERLTVWTVQSPGKKARVFYMLDKRVITYF